MSELPESAEGAAAVAEADGPVAGYLGCGGGFSLVERGLVLGWGWRWTDLRLGSFGCRVRRRFLAVSGIGGLKGSFGLGSSKAGFRGS